MKRFNNIIGHKINPGLDYAMILANKDDSRLEGYIVLAIIPGRKEFVTWWMNEKMEPGHGHYFLTLEGALEDYDSRS